MQATRRALLLCNRVCSRAASPYGLVSRPAFVQKIAVVGGTTSIRHYATGSSQYQSQSQSQSQSQYQQQDDQGPPAIATGSETPVSNSPVIEVGLHNFNEVVAKSPVPIIVTFYADWDAACKEILPKLEEAVLAADGALRLAKVNTDKYPDLAQQLQITEVPTIISVENGKAERQPTVTDAAGVTRLITYLLKTAGPKPILKAAERCVQTGDIATARQLYTDLLHNKQLKSEAAALGGLVSCALAEKKLEDAAQLANVIKEQYKDDLTNPFVKKALSALELAEATKGGDSGKSVAELEEAVAKNPDDLQALHDLAVQYFSQGKAEQAIETALKGVKKNKTFNEEAFRKLLVKVSHECITPTFFDTCEIFEVLGSDNPLVQKGRRRFSSLWYL